jgi:RNA polymerase sigma-B factor
VTTGDEKAGFGVEKPLMSEEHQQFTENTELFAQLPDPGAREELVELYMPLALSLARRYSNRGQDQDDLKQVALLALVHAIDRFDPEMGKRFTSFAVPTILGELKRYFRDSAWGVGVPRRLKDLWVLSRQANEELAQVLGRSPTVEEIGERIGCSAEDVAEAASLGSAFRAESLDGPDEALGPIDVIGEIDDEVDLFDEIDALAPVLADRSERERQILHLRFYREMNQREIAEVMGMSQMNVSRILSSTLEKMRCILSA